MSITFANAEQATNYLMNRDKAAKAWRRYTKDALVMAAQDFGCLNSREELRRWTIDELIGYLLDAKFSQESVNLAIHVRTHTQSFPDCPHCQADQAKLAEDTFALIERSEAGQR